MPYIKVDRRNKIDKSIEQLAKTLSSNRENKQSLEEILGDINYSFSRILAILMEKPNYNKVAMITGVLENIKQEFYRRIATPYENQKIEENGDVHEYDNLC